MPVDIEALLDLATTAAHEAGSLLVERFHRPASGVDSKSTSTDLVSDADRDSEVLILDVIARERPGDGVLGEEGAGKASSTGLTWVVDPLDGTVNFLYGIPWWCVSIAVQDTEGEAVGTIHNPILGETFSAIRGDGAWLNGEAIHVGGCSEISEALFATGFAYPAEARMVQGEVVSRVLPGGRDIRRMGSAALDLCSVACGRVDVFYESHLAEWDKAAGRLIVTEAGGVLTELEPPVADLTPGLLASNHLLHDAALQLLKG